MRVQKYAFALSFAKEIGKLMDFYFHKCNFYRRPTPNSLNAKKLFDIWYTI